MLIREAIIKHLKNQERLTVHEFDHMGDPKWADLMVPVAVRPLSLSFAFSFLWIPDHLHSSVN